MLYLTCVRIRAANNKSFIIPQFSDLSNIDAILGFETKS